MTHNNTRSFNVSLPIELIKQIEKRHVAECQKKGKAESKSKFVANLLNQALKA